MATSITADDMLDALKKWGITPRFYRSDWRSHNRNAAQGWGPLRGFILHNFGSDGSDSGSLSYLDRGDNARGLPGPLCQFAITDDGQVWVMGWGAANHAGPGDKRTDDLIRRDAMPLDRDIVPTTTMSSPSSQLATLGAHYMGVEMTYGKAPTAAQRVSVTRLGAALMDMLGGPADGYSGGSICGHRETTRTRSDPVGIPMGPYRRDVNALLAAGTTTTKPPATKPTTPAPPKENDNMAALSSKDIRGVWFADIIPAPAENAKGGNVNFAPASYLQYTHKAAIETRAAVAELTVQVQALTALVQALTPKP